MNDSLLTWYNRELSHIRKVATQFAEAHPKIATRLRLGPDFCEDPHTERLIEAFAYLTARVRRKLDDDFPELTEGLLGVLYPHYLAPIPSMTIVQLDLDPKQAELLTGYTLPAKLPLETEPIQGEPCRFATGYPVTLWPIDLKTAQLARPPMTCPQLTGVKPTGILRLSLACRGKAATFGKLAPETLRFFLKGQPQHIYPLYELLLNNVLAIAIANAPDDKSPIRLDPSCITPVGFGRDEGLLPFPKRSFPGYRLLMEYFVFPEKFLFIDLKGLDKTTLANIGPNLEVFVYLNRTITDLEPNVSSDTFRLGCTPAVNLFPIRAEPIGVDETTSEYHVVSDSRRPLSLEIYSIDRVSAVGRDGEGVPVEPFFSVRHGVTPTRVFWSATRRPAEPTKGVVDHGTELHLTLVDLDLNPAAPADTTLEIECTCLNRDLPGRLPFGGDQPKLRISEGGGLVKKVTCLTAPTRTRRPAARDGYLWRLISHLSLNHLSLVDSSEGADALREILRLYDVSDSAETRAMIDGVVNVSSGQAIGRVTGTRGGAICRGVDVTIQFDPDRFAGSGLFLFASVLERFLALYATVNSFTRLTATLRGREGVLRRWPPRLGEQVLV
jgi:type VI secretion system protein ImpG